MSEKEKKYLLDMLMAIEEIELFFNGTYNFNEFKSNAMLKSAVERQLITVGEAMNRLLVINPTLSITSARNIVQFRNKITHEYDAVDDVITWAVVINHLPVLKREVNAFLEKI
jgi:uncharacterized protein with HEPN domain